MAEAQEPHPSMNFQADLVPLISINGINHMGWTLNNDMSFMLMPGRVLIPAHSQIVGQYFQRFCTATEQQLLPNAVLQINEYFQISTDAFREIMRFMYSGGRIQLNESNAEILMRAGHGLQIDALEEHCITYLLARLTITNVCKYYHNSYLIRNRFIEKCQAIIQAETMKVLENGTLMDMKIEALRTIIKELPLNINGEFELYKAMLDYAHRRCNFLHIQSSANNMRSQLTDRLRYVRFPAMRADEFIKCYGLNLEFFSPIEFHEMLVYIITPVNCRPGHEIYSNVRRPQFTDEFSECKRLVHETQIYEIMYETGAKFRLNAQRSVVVYGLRVYGTGKFLLRKDGQPIDTETERDDTSDSYRVMMSDPMEVHPGNAFRFELIAINLENVPYECKCIDLRRSYWSADDVQIVMEPNDEHRSRVIGVLYTIQRKREEECYT